MYATPPPPGSILFEFLFLSLETKKSPVWLQTQEPPASASRVLTHDLELLLSKLLLSQMTNACLCVGLTLLDVFFLRLTQQVELTRVLALLSKNVFECEGVWPIPSNMLVSVVHSTLYSFLLVSTIILPNNLQTPFHSLSTWITV